MEFKSNFCLVTAILPKENANDIIKQSVPAEINSLCIISARGSIYKDKWYQKFTPSLNPEQTVIEILLPNNLADQIVQKIAEAAHLQSSGTGAVYCTPCEKSLFVSENEFEIASIEKPESEIHFRNNYSGIYCIIQKNLADSVALAAMRAGSPGPTVVFGQGRGIREKLGLLRVAISPEKELVRVVVDNYDVEPVFEAMVSEGKLDTPGMGFIYIMPVSKGLVNIASVAAGKHELATNHQIIKAIDEIKGGSEWRMNLNSSNKVQRKYLNDLVRLTCVTERGMGDALTQAAMASGAPGASITYGVKRKSNETQGTTGIAVNQEVEIIEMTLAPKVVDDIVTTMLKAADENKNNNLYFYTQKVPKALTYLG
ncbi:MAG: P-II family nitrogen regulator [Sphingobacteriaceae bacterium]|nr:P-II family nitrogen regulator [Sphingobacteriaceae bacterium]